jgi:predicted DNA-binding protein
MRENTAMDEMKEQYDFSKGVRGKFYVAEDDIRLPRYLEPVLEKRLKRVAEKAGSTPEALLNILLENELNAMEKLQS